MNQILFAGFNALAFGMSIFLVAAGLTLIFGILKLLNMAQGAFFMIGAYVAFSILGTGSSSFGFFLLAALGAGLIVALLGLITDRLVLTRLRHVDYHYVLIATFALMMVCNGLVKLIWGVEFVSVNPPTVLDEPVELGSLFVSRYTLFIIAAGLVVYLVMEVALHRLWFGKLMQALAADSWMAGLLGLNVPLGLALSVMVSFFLAGLAGGLLLPNQSLSPQLGDSYLLFAFFAVIIGGLGNIRGAFVGSILLGLVSSLNTVLLPDMPGIAIYVALAVFLFVRPTGLFPSRATQAEPASDEGGGSLARSRIGRGVWQVLGLAVAAFAASMPLWANEGLLFLAGSTLVQGLFALSWNILFGYAGLASFGHAAFFALGAYLAGAVLRYWPAVPFLATLLGAGALGAAVAFVVGALALRRMSGIFLAVLTVALSEAMRVLISYSPLLGREDGLVNIPRPVLHLPFAIDLTSSAAYFWFLLVTTAAIVAVLWWAMHGRYGRKLLSVRQDPERAAFLGVNVTGVRIGAFMLSGGVAAVAGALYAPWARIVTLDEVHWLASTQPVLNAMLGGVNSFWGPLLGSAVFTVINYGTRTLIGLSELIVGTILLFIVLVAPGGIVGVLRSAEAAWIRRRGGAAAPAAAAAAPGAGARP
ncbi:ABC transporter permease [Chelatococcus reniformis]|uniref:ABC transporter permease n=1 Tax=Chelatococcus reniformis TaxID=1494448 RepID=A0A916UH03_9HYPH|nr:ABC transporter permease [Chelatococcus reniformis]GGC72553.1 hypothetical protein GCM10010994_33700 [Chelatococcus reniformis]